MSKLSLNVEELVVDSFDTASQDATRLYGGGWSDDSVCPSVTGRCCPP